MTKTKVAVEDVEAGDRVMFPGGPETVREVVDVRQDEAQPNAPVSVWTTKGEPFRHANPDRPTDQIRVSRGRQWVWVVS